MRCVFKKKYVELVLQIEDGTDVRACVASTALVETIFGEKVRALYDLKKKDKAAFRSARARLCLHVCARGCPCRLCMAYKYKILV